MKKLAFVGVAVLWLGMGTVAAQKFEVPANYVLEKKADFKKYEKEVLKCVDWLEKVKTEGERVDVTPAETFLAEWVTECPYINYTHNVRIDGVFGECPGLSTYFMAGWVRNALTNPKATPIDNSVAGMRCAVEVYQMNHSFPRSKAFAEVVKAEKKGSLKEWVADRL